MMMHQTDLLVFATLFIFSLLFMFVIPPVNVGFFCDDESIQYPYIKEDTTIFTASSLVLIFSTCLLVILAVEYFNSKYYLFHFIVELMPFMFGYLITLSTTMFCKCMVGRLAPNFVDICKPDMSNCTDPVTNKTLKGVYIPVIICQNVDQTRSNLFDSRSSFFSCHASLAAYSLLYLSIYIHHKMPKLPTLCRSVIQIGLINVALFVGYSRLYYNRHHWSDVFVGLIVGSLIAIYIMTTVRPHYAVHLVPSLQNYYPVSEESENLINSESIPIDLVSADCSSSSSSCILLPSVSGYQPVNNNLTNDTDSLKLIKQFFTKSRNGTMMDNQLDCLSMSKKDLHYFECDVEECNSDSDIILKNVRPYPFYQTI